MSRASRVLHEVANDLAVAGQLQLTMMRVPPVEDNAPAASSASAAPAAAAADPASSSISRSVDGTEPLWDERTQQHLWPVLINGQTRYLSRIQLATETNSLNPRPTSATLHPRTGHRSVDSVTALAARAADATADALALVAQARAAAPEWTAAAPQQPAVDRRNIPQRSRPPLPCFSMTRDRSRSGAPPVARDEANQPQQQRHSSTRVDRSSERSAAPAAPAQANQQDEQDHRAGISGRLLL